MRASPFSKFYEITGVKTDLPNNNNANVANNTDAVENISEGFVFKHSGFPMSLLDVNGVVKFANPSFLKVTGFTQADVDDGKVGMFSMSSKEDLAQMYLNAGELICGGKQFVHFQKRCKIANEKYYWQPCGCPTTRRSHRWQHFRQSQGW